jgi:asparagine synthase (glutamine-hydrolysing)
MCGIAGIHSPGAVSEGRSDLVARMLQVIAHRGPDHVECLALATGAIGHARLAILDLSAEANQPMASANGRYHIALNGEIYNFIELREEIRALGAHFRTGSDAEVAVEAYAMWGARCLDRFNGMWALAIHDRDRDEWFLARDRFGVKPLYLARLGEAIIFASEMKALLAAGIEPEPDLDIVATFVGGGAYDADDATPFARIRALPAGHSCILKDGAMHIAEWWSLRPGGETVAARYEDRVAAFRDLLEDAVRLRLRSDVDVAVTLSGGIDSAAIYTIARALVGDGRAVAPTSGSPLALRAVSLVYPGEAVDESRWIRSTVGGAPELEVSPGPSDLPRLIDECLWHQESFVWEPVVIAMHMLYRRIREAGMPVVLEGHGADEMLAGYPGLVQAALRTGVRTVDPRLALDALRSYQLSLNESLGDQRARPLRTLLAEVGAARALAGAVRPFRRRGAGAPRSGLAAFAPELASRIRPPASGRENLRPALAQAFTRDILPGILRVWDRAAMASAVESRMPFMDYRVVRYVFSLPAGDIVGGGENKHILRDAMRGSLPEDVVRQRPKIGFPVPTLTWLRDGKVRSWLGEVIHDPGFGAGGLIDSRRFATEFDRVMARGAQWHEAVDIWKVVSLDRWWRLFVEPGAQPPASAPPVAVTGR